MTASKTQNSLEEINKNVRAVVSGIENLYNETARSSENMLAMSRQAEDLMSNAGATGDKLHTSVDISSNLVKKCIYIATKTKTLIESMNDLVRLSEEIRGMASGVGEVSTNLADKSTNLQSRLNRFTV